MPDVIGSQPYISTPPRQHSTRCSLGEECLVGPSRVFAIRTLMIQMEKPTDELATLIDVEDTARSDLLYSDLRPRVSESIFWKIDRVSGLKRR